MKTLKAYTIKFSGLELGTHTYDYQLDNAFFKHFGFSEFEQAGLSAKVHLEKKSNRLELLFSISGTVEVRCDVSNKVFEMPLSTELELLVKFGDRYDDSHEDILVLPQNEYELNISQYLYEGVAVAVPLKKVDPSLEESEEGREMLSKLKEYSPQAQIDSEEKDQENTDPRWDKLKDLLN